MPLRPNKAPQGALGSARQTSECEVRFPLPITADRACNFWPGSEGSITLVGAYLGAYSKIDLYFSRIISDIGYLFDSPRPTIPEPGLAPGFFTPVKGRGGVSRGVRICVVAGRPYFESTLDRVT